MKSLFTLVDWELQVSTEAWGLLPFAAIKKRDKTKSKTQALKEMLFLYYYADTRSMYSHMEEQQKISEIKKDIGLKDSWEIDNVMREAIDFYASHRTVIEELYMNASIGAKEVGLQLKNAKSLMAQEDKSGKPIYKIADLTRGLKDVKVIMRELKEAEAEVIKERKENAERHSGSKIHNLFETGI